MRVVLNLILPPTRKGSEWEDAGHQRAEDEQWRSAGRSKSCSRDTDAEIYFSLSEAAFEMEGKQS